MPARPALAAMVATLAVLALPGIASACNTPEVGLNKATAGPGDTIGFTIVNLEPGGTYEVTVEGHALGSGTSTSAHGFSGTTAPLPDLGANRQVEIRFHLVHNGPPEPRHETGPWTREPSIAFVGPVSAESPTKAAPQPAGEPPAGEQTAAQHEPEARATPPAIARSTRPAAPNTTASRTTARTQGARRPATRPARRIVARPRAVAPSPTAAAETARAATAAAPRPRRMSSARSPARRSTTTPARALPPQRASASRAAAPASGTRPGSRGGVDSALSALALVLLAHAAAGLARLRRRVPAAALPDTCEFDALGIEHELQEMIAAERAAARATTSV